jgi:non-homologous end joining protein Ku
MQPLTSATSSGVTLSLGMIAVTVSVHGAVGEDESRSMKIVCSHGHAPTPIKQHQRCDVIHPAVGEDEPKPCANATGAVEGFGRARAVDAGFVVIPPEVLEKDKDANALFKKSIALTVHPTEEVTSVLMPSGKSYYLALKTPNAATLYAYSLLSRMVADHPEKAYMAKFSLRSATSVFQLTVAGKGTLVLRQMADAALVREHPSIAFTDLDARTLELAGMVAEQQLTPFLVAEHGTGKSSIIADYAATQTPQSPVQVADTTKPMAGGSIADLTAALEMMLAPTPITTATKKATARKRAARKPATTTKAS